MALYLRERGYRAFALRGGYKAWKDAGYATLPKEAEMAAGLPEICPECHGPMADHMT